MQTTHKWTHMHETIVTYMKVFLISVNTVSDKFSSPPSSLLSHLPLCSVDLWKQHPNDEHLSPFFMFSNLPLFLPFSLQCSPTPTLTQQRDKTRNLELLKQGSGLKKNTHIWQHVLSDIHNRKSGVLLWNHKGDDGIKSNLKSNDGKQTKAFIKALIWVIWSCDCRDHNRKKQKKIEFRKWSAQEKNTPQNQTKQSSQMINLCTSVPSNNLLEMLV